VSSSDQTALGEPLTGELIESNQMTNANGELVENMGFAFLIVMVACLVEPRTC
jgi:hypothetical protein